MLFFDVTKKKYTYDSQSKKMDSYDSQWHGNFQADTRFCYDIRGKSCDKYDPCYAVLLRTTLNELE